MTTKFKPEEWWPVLALSCDYLTTVREATSLLTLLIRHRPTAKQWQDGRFEERYQPAFLDSAIATIQEAIKDKHSDDFCDLPFTVGESFAIYLCLAGKSNRARGYLSRGVSSLMMCLHRALYQMSEMTTPKDAKEILEWPISSWLRKIEEDFNRAAEKEKRK